MSPAEAASVVFARAGTPVPAAALDARLREIAEAAARLYSAAVTDDDALPAALLGDLLAVTGALRAVLGYSGRGPASRWRRPAEFVAVSL